MKSLAYAAAAAMIVAGAPAAAGASPSRSVDVYFHGGARQAVFASKAACAPYAASMARNVAARSASGYSFVPLMPAVNTPENRANARGCFPMSNGKWTYVTAYVAPTGRPVIAGDERVPTFQAGWSGGRPVTDRASYYTVRHLAMKPANSWTQAQCVADRNRVLAAVKTRSTTAPELVTECHVQGSDRWYEVDYFVTTPKGVLGEDPGRVVIAEDGNVTPDWYFDWSVTRHGM